MNSLNRPVDPGLKIRTDVNERIGVDDIPRDRRIGLPAVAVESDWNEIVDRHRRTLCDLPGKVIEAKE